MATKESKEIEIRSREVFCSGGGCSDVHVGVMQQNANDWCCRREGKLAGTEVLEVLV